MNTHLKLRHVISVFCVLIFCGGCDDDASKTSIALGTDANFLVTPQSIGDYRIGHSTLEGILGSDSVENKKRFADDGLYFEFNRGKELTGVTVNSNRYSLENGLTIGSPARDVRGKLGEPRETKIELKPKGIQIDALVYNDFTFLLDQSKKVAAIRIGN